MQEAVIVSAVRIPTGKFLGALKDIPAPAARRAGRARGGRAAPASTRPRSTNASWATSSRPASGQAPARQAALKGGLANHVAALTINKVCGSGLKAVMLAQQGIADRRHRDRGRRRHGVDEQRARTCSPRRAKDCAWATAQMIDSMIHDGLWCPFENWHMGNAGETVAEPTR